MQDISWDESLSVEVDEIDDDHRKLVDLFNLLKSSVAEDAAPEYIEAVFDELMTCTAWHFKHEERLMLTHRYDGFEDHKNEHDELIDSIKTLRKRCFENGEPLSEDDFEFLSDWLTGHILGRDMKLGFYLAEVI